MNAQVTDPNPPQNPDRVNENVIHAIRDEVQHEFAHIQNTRTPVDSTQSDVLVQKHVNGLVILLFVVVVLVLLAAIGGIYFYSHAHAAHPVNTVGELTQFRASTLRAA